ncbi:MAG: hypothetical protein IJ812_03900, partial [Schwartzia sp.]|nr:hypothetical protein [Schwartzia sp. (in: firmicutes)]
MTICAPYFFAICADFCYNERGRFILREGRQVLGLKIASYPVYWATLAFAGFCRLLPESGAAVLGSWIGSGVWHFLPEHRKNRARVSLREYFGADPEETERILRASLERYGPM